MAEPALKSKVPDSKIHAHFHHTVLYFSVNINFFHDSHKVILLDSNSSHMKQVGQTLYFAICQMGKQVQAPRFSSGGRTARSVLFTLGVLTPERRSKLLLKPKRDLVFQLLL